MWEYSMDLSDPVDLAQVAIERVSTIASQLAREKKRVVCGELAAVLFILVSVLKDPSPDQELRLRTRILKLLVDIEAICCWPKGPTCHQYPLLRDLAGIDPRLRAQAEQKIRSGLDIFTSRDYVSARTFISHIMRFSKKFEIKYFDQDPAPPKTSPAEYPDHVNAILYDTLCRECQSCTCTDAGVQNAIRQQHLSALLLKPTCPPISDGHVRFDMLFSSKPSSNQTKSIYWQDVHLIVPRSLKSGKKRARFAGNGDDNFQPSPAKSPKAISAGRFCELIGLELGSRISLRIQDQELFESSEPLKQRVEHSPAISLATVLRRHHLTAKMKVVLAYILARSVWQFYESDWMKTEWTSETIQFIRECCGNNGSLFASRPYLSVRFGEAAFDLPEHRDSGFHRYPRVLALGIMLVEIGTGSLISASEGLVGQSYITNVNHRWRLAVQYSNSPAPWPEFDYSTYRTAVKNCLDPFIFNSAEFDPELGEKECRRRLESRRKILYDSVVFPLEQFLHGTGWANDLATIGPIESELRQPMPLPPTSGLSASIGGKKTTTKGRKKSESWLACVKRVNSDLFPRDSVHGPPRLPRRRVKIAVLDTGYQEDAPFFDSRGARLKGWKDWVDDSAEPLDANGHGTYMVALVMTIAPEADIYVARVAKDPESLADSAINVAEAVSYAHSKWKVDIVSMSFGFARDEQQISSAIRTAVIERNDSILFFAAAANFGANEREMFPARHENVISIRATNSEGKFKDFNPPPNQQEGIVYGTLGSDVPLALWDSKNVIVKSGSSVATAIAAGLAAMLLGYVGWEPSKARLHEVQEKLQTRRGMLAMFDHIGLLTKEKCHYVAPWRITGCSEDVRWAQFLSVMDFVP